MHTPTHAHTQYSNWIFQNETVEENYPKMAKFLISLIKSTLTHSVVAALNPAVKYNQSEEN